ncbi:MAG: hemerythrin domain-containing protein [Sedimentisphaerales bacterium]|nr:hemerythrin domain-containing protein [Sedimentisphaerales bacterium]
MKPIGPLMVEHRLIERMLVVLEQGLDAMRDTDRADTDLIAIGVDFFRTYADRTHHGKEEDILFKALVDKPLTGEQRQTMRRLMHEHVWARQAVGKLASANDRYRTGDAAALQTILYELGKLIEFYPQHIETEDRRFFLPVMDYFTATEQQAMLAQFQQFDAQQIHDKYAALVEQAEASRRAEH